MAKNEHCKQLLGNLSDYINGELDDELCSELTQHLENCQDCQIVVDTLKKTIYLYHTTAQEPVDVPENVRQRLYKCLDMEEYLNEK